MTANNMERIMVIEDLPDNLLVLQATLEHEGYKVLPMMDGESAIQFLKEEQGPIDLVLSDVMMPGLSGYDLCRNLRHDPALAHLPIVLITAKRLNERDALLGIEAGADDYLIRPIDPQLLNRKLRLLLDRKRDLEHWQNKYQDKKKEIESTEWGARMLVHDIRNPLGAAMGAIKMLGMDPNTTEDQRFLINLAQNCLQTQMGMLQDMLTTVAAKNGSLVLNKQTFDLGACVKEQVSFQQGVMATEHCDFHCQGLEDGLSVTADKQLIGRVVDNLIVNALKYGRKRSGVEIWSGPPEKCPLPITGQGVTDHGASFRSSALPPNCKRLQGAADARNRPASYSPLCEQADDSVQYPLEGYKADAVSCDRLRQGGLAFMIINQGSAIPKDIHQQIFQPFTMGNNARQIQDRDNSVLTTGVGLGLCFCQKVIDLHGGFINIISPLPGQDDGVAFYFILP